MGGDLLPAASGLREENTFLDDFLLPQFRSLKKRMGSTYPSIYLIMGNDDPRSEEKKILEADEDLWYYLHKRKREYHGYTLFGFSCVPPTPFLLKDWERYDVSRFVDPGSVHPTEGVHTTPLEKNLKYVTIKDELAKLCGDEDLSRAVLLLHAPPYNTTLDRAGLDGETVEGVPMDVHVGSIAIREFIEERQPLLTLHGHIHEACRLTGCWQDTIGRTVALSAAIESPSLALVSFSLEDLESAERRVL
jgi:Icc-related predicted phosphoesterase